MPILIRVLAALILLFGSNSHASQHSMTQKLFQVESEVLDNGLHIIRHHSDNSDTFSAHLVVELGLKDFDCEKKQTPHLLEHMVFEGTRQFDRKTLRQRIKNHGGKSQAFTVEEYTHYTLTVHSDYPQIALENLHSMMAEPVFDETSFQLSQQIIHTELGTSHNSINPLWANTSVLTSTARAQIYQGTELYCAQLTNPNNISLTEVEAFFKSHYVASNMTLILLGHFNDKKVSTILQRTFAQMKKVEKPRAQPLPQHKSNYEPIRARSTAFDPQAELYMFIPAVGEQNPQAQAYQIITEYLGEQLFYQVRGEKGLGYTPRAWLNNNSEIGIIETTTRTNDQLLDQAEQAFLMVYQQLVQRGIPSQDIERLKRQLILQFESQQRDHVELAQLYRHHRHAIQQHGSMPNLVKAIEGVNQQQVDQVLQSFPQQPLIATLSRPPMTRMLLYIILVSVIATTLAWPLLRWMRKQQHR